MRKAYLVDVGMLIERHDPEYEAYACYGDQYGYYDKDQYLCTNLEKAIRDCKAYVSEGEERTYGVVTKQEIPDEQFVQLKACEDARELAGEVGQIRTGAANYSLEAVVYSARKCNRELDESFVEE